MSLALGSREIPEIIHDRGTTYRTELMLSREQISEKVEAMGATLAHSYAEKGLDTIFTLTVMKGAFRFAADLTRSMLASNPNLRIISNQIKLSSYNGTASTGHVQIEGNPPGSMTGRHVLVIDDILDSGGTLKWLEDYVNQQNPASLEAAVVLTKDTPVRPAGLLGGIAIHSGFDIENVFVVGYGLDLNQDFRHLNGIYQLEEATAQNI